MKKMVIFLSVLMLTAQAFATTRHQETATHTVTLTGLAPDEGRYIRSDVYENDQFLSGYFFCAKNNDSIYSLEYAVSRTLKHQRPFHVEHLTRFSICQDETLAHCQEFATDKYQTFAGIDGYLHNDATKVEVDVSPVKELYHACEPNPAMDEMVQNSIHLNDRRFARVG